MVGIGATKAQALLVLAHVSDEGVHLEGPTVGWIGLDDKPIVETMFLAQLFGTNGLDCGESELVLHMDTTCGMVHEDTPTNML